MSIYIKELRRKVIYESPIFHDVEFETEKKGGNDNIIYSIRCNYKNYMRLAHGLYQLTGSTYTLYALISNRPFDKVTIVNPTLINNWHLVHEDNPIIKLTYHEGMDRELLRYWYHIIEKITGIKHQYLVTKEKIIEIMSKKFPNHRLVGSKTLRNVIEVNPLGIVELEFVKNG